MKELIIHEERCKSCQYCIKHCPKKALRVSNDHVNEKGYATVQVDLAACILCGMCFTVCPDYVFEIKEEN